MATDRFTFRIGRRSAGPLRLWGVRPDRAWVTVDDRQVIARFGYFEIRVPLANIARWRIEGPWRWITAIGVRRSIRHADVTFGGNHRGGVRIDFREPITLARLRVPALYVTVEDLEGLAAALAGHGIPGVDARTPS
jgi:hypothetical protein